MLENKVPQTSTNLKGADYLLDESSTGGTCEENNTTQQITSQSVSLPPLGKVKLIKHGSSSEVNNTKRAELKNIGNTGPIVANR